MDRRLRGRRHLVRDADRRTTLLAYRNTLSDLLARSDKRPPSILDFGPFDRELAEVVAAMLSPLPSERPTAKVLTSTLRAIVCKLGPAPKVDKTSQVGAPILRALLEDTTEPTALASRELRERQFGMPEPLSVGGSETVEAPPPIDATAPSPAGVAMRVAVGAASAAEMVNAGRARPRPEDGRPVGGPKRVEPAPISQLSTEPPSQFVAAPPNVRPVYVDRRSTTDLPTARRTSIVRPRAIRRPERDGRSRWRPRASPGP